MKKTTDTKWWVVKVPKGCNAKKAYALCQKKFTCWICSESALDNVTEDRVATKAYTIELKPNVEADEEHKNKSAEELKAAGIQGTTLTERLLLELQYFEATGQHLDIVNWTLCSGSRDDDGDVPYVSWLPGDRKLCVYWSEPSYSDDYLRCREAVSCSLDSFSFNPLPSESSDPSQLRRIELKLDKLLTHLGQGEYVESWVKKRDGK